MGFVTSDGLTEEGTSRTVEAGGTTIHYHDVGDGPPVMFMHTYGPGSTAWITWFKVLPFFAKHYRCVLMDLPNYTKTGPIVYEDSHHKVDARTALALMDHLGIERAHMVGNSQGGQASMVFAYTYPERVNKLVWGAGHIGTMGGYHNEYLFSNYPEEGDRACMKVYDDPSVENFTEYLRIHIFDESLVTDELVHYVRDAHLARPDLMKAMLGSTSTPADHSGALAQLNADTLLIWGRNDRMCTFEIGINALNLTPNARLILLRDTAHWAPFEKPHEYAAHVLSFLRGYEDVG